MLTTNNLKTWLHKDLSQGDKVLLVLASFDNAVHLRDIKLRATEAGFKKLLSWNLSRALNGIEGLAINTPHGWEITEAGKQRLRKLGVSKVSPAAMQVAVDLRLELEKIKNKETRAFVEEAIQCLESELFRSAIVMSWLAAISVLHNYVVKCELQNFNDEARRVDQKWKKAKTADDLGRMKESDFLDRIAAISIINKNIKTELKDCLNRRNAAGHPNSMKFGYNNVAHHIEVLLLNVFKKFK